MKLNRYNHRNIMSTHRYGVEHELSEQISVSTPGAPYFIDGDVRPVVFLFSFSRFSHLVFSSTQIHATKPRLEWKNSLVPCRMTL